MTVIVRILAIGSHSERPLSGCFLGGKGNEEKVEPLIIGVENPDQVGTRGSEPVHGNLPAAVEPKPARSAVPSGHVQRDPTDRRSLDSDCREQCGQLEDGICRPWPPRTVESTRGGTTRFQAQACRATTGSRTARGVMIKVGGASRRHVGVPVPA